MSDETCNRRVAELGEEDGLVIEENPDFALGSPNPQAQLTDDELKDVTAWQDAMDAATQQMQQWAATQISQQVKPKQAITIPVHAAATGELLASPLLSMRDTVLDLILEVMRDGTMPLRPTLRLNDAVLDVETTIASSGISEGSCVYAEVHAAIITCSEDTTSKIWDAETGKCVLHLRGHTGPVNFACFAPDCSTVATCSEDCTTKLWSLWSGTCVHTLCAHTDSVTYAVFSPDGSFLVTASDDRTANIWNPSNGQCIHTLKAHSAAVYSISIDGSNIKTIARDGTTIAWDAKSGKYERSDYTEPPAVQVYSYAPGGRLTVTTAGSQEAKVWDIKTGDCEMTLVGHERQVIHAMFAPECAGMRSL